jgi:hypothetical protein
VVRDGEWRDRSAGLREKGRKYLGFDAHCLERIRAALAAHAGRRSPTVYSHFLRCRAHAGGRPVRPIKRWLRLTSGPSSIQFSKIFNLSNFQIQNGGLPDVQNSPNFA